MEARQPGTALPWRPGKPCSAGGDGQRRTVLRSVLRSEMARLPAPTPRRALCLSSSSRRPPCPGSPIWQSSCSAALNSAPAPEAGCAPPGRLCFAAAPLFPALRDMRRQPAYVAGADHHYVVFASPDLLFICLYSELWYGHNSDYIRQSGSFLIALLDFAIFLHPASELDFMSVSVYPCSMEIRHFGGKLCGRTGGKLKAREFVREIEAQILSGKLHARHPAGSRARSGCTLRPSCSSVIPACWSWSAGLRCALCRARAPSSRTFCARRRRRRCRSSWNTARQDGRLAAA